MRRRQAGESLVKTLRTLAVSVAERMGSSGQVASGRLSRDPSDGTVGGCLATAVAARGEGPAGRERFRREHPV